MIIVTYAVTFALAGIIMYFFNKREKIDIKLLNAEIEQIVVREQALRDEIAKIIAEIEGKV